MLKTLHLGPTCIVNGRKQPRLATLILGHSKSLSECAARATMERWERLQQRLNNDDDDNECSTTNDEDTNDDDDAIWGMS